MASSCVKTNSLHTLATACGVLILSAHNVHAGFEAKDTKIINFAWVTPTAPVSSSQLSSNQHLPFDGVVTDLVRNNPTIGQGNPIDLFAWKAWGESAVNAASFSQATSAIASTHLGRYRNSLLRFNVAGGQTDFFGSYAGVLANAQLASQVVSQVGFDGILLDTEYYFNVAPGQAFNYQAQPQKSLHSFDAYKARARQVGAQFMTALRSEKPDIKVMLTFGYDSAGFNQSAWVNEPYGLMPAFLDGMLDAAQPGNVIYDGWENGYGYTSSSQYENAYQTMRFTNSLNTINPTGFADYHRASYGFWLDRGADGINASWNPDNINANSYSPAQLEFVLQEAAKRSDRYVWVYSQTAEFWGGNVPQPYIDALKNVRKVGQLERFRGTTKDTATWEQRTEALGMVTQNNGILLDAVNNSTASLAEYTTKLMTVEIGGLVSVEMRNNTSTANTGLSQLARQGLILSNNSGGTVNSALFDSRALLLLWSNNDNALLAGKNDATGLNQFTTLAGQDHPTGASWIYQIERLTSTSARFSVVDTNGGAVIGTPQVLSFADMPRELVISLYSHSGDALFNNVWVSPARHSEWAHNGSGFWNNSGNWTTVAIPNGTDSRAAFDAATSAARTILTDEPVTVGAIRFDNIAGYQISGQGSLAIDVTGGLGTIEVVRGLHRINLPLRLNDSTIVSVAAGAELKISNPLTLAATAQLTKTGTGTLSIEAPVITEGPLTFRLAGGTTVVSHSLGDDATLLLAGGHAQLEASQTLSSLHVDTGEALVGPRADTLVTAARVTLGSSGRLTVQGALVVNDATAEGEVIAAVRRSAIRTGLESYGLSIGFIDAALLSTSSSLGLVLPEEAAGMALVCTLTGDANLDREVNAADFALLTANLDTAGDWSKGDFNHDGWVDSIDAAILLSNFNRSFADAVASASLPDPAAGLGLIPLLALRRRSRA